MQVSANWWLSSQHLRQAPEVAWLEAQLSEARRAGLQARPSHVLRRASGNHFKT
jgi:hypothetical protein